MLTETGYNVDDPKNMKKRKEYLAWDDYFMAIAFLSAQRSKDPNAQVGACIVDKENRITGIGYNGFPRGCPDDCLPWGTHSSSMQEDGNATTPYLHTKDAYMCHAEVNAILNKRSADVTGARMYVGQFPCKCEVSVLERFIDCLAVT
jgi:dCMP deaminase